MAVKDGVKLKRKCIICRVSSTKHPGTLFVNKKTNKTKWLCWVCTTHALNDAYNNMLSAIGEDKCNT